MNWRTCVSDNSYQLKINYRCKHCKPEEFVECQVHWTGLNSIERVTLRKSRDELSQFICYSRVLLSILTCQVIDGNLMTPTHFSGQKAKSTYFFSS